MAAWRLVLVGAVVFGLSHTGSELLATMRLAAKAPEFVYFFERMNSVESKLRNEVLGACVRLYDTSFAEKCNEVFYTEMLQNMAYALGADQL